MGREIKIRDIGKYHRESVELAVQATTLEWEKRCKEETPVDTGNLRNGQPVAPTWRPTLERPDRRSW